MTTNTVMPVDRTSNADGGEVQVVKDVYLPEQLLDRYISVAMRWAIPRPLEGQWYADLQHKGFAGVWGTGDSPKQCLDTLQEVLRDWIILKIADEDRDLPVVDEIDLTFLY
jgi:hypothetical protein